MRAQVERLWRASPLLTATGFGMLLVLLASLAAMVIDSTQIQGAPAWIFTFLPTRARLTTIVARITCSVRSARPRGGAASCSSRPRATTRSSPSFSRKRSASTR